MQVTCPRCGARYVVDPTAIGPSGRKVQCVRCNHLWFEKTTEPSSPAAAAPSRPAPDFVVRSSMQSTTLPGRVGRIPKDRWGTWLAVVLGLIFLAALLAFAYRNEIRDGLPPQWQSLLTWQSLRTLLSPTAGSGIVVHGEVISNGRTVSLAEAFKITAPSIE